MLLSLYRSARAEVARNAASHHSRALRHKPVGQPDESLVGEGRLPTASRQSARRTRQARVVPIALCIALAGSGSEVRAQDVHATNSSTATLCAEDDNINIPLTGRVSSFVVEATHPTYVVGADSCLANLTSCSIGGTGYPFPPGVFKLFDDHVTVVEAVRENVWWRPNGMTVSVDSDTPVSDIHYVRVYRKIADANQWPQFFALYMDGNLRLKPQAPAGQSDVCFGSSVIVGSAAPASRPIAEIASVRYVSSTQTMEVLYQAGGSAVLNLSEVDRTKARVRVTVDYPTATWPFATFRSMYVAAGNADVDRVSWKDASGSIDDSAILSFAGGDGTEFFFYRQARSQHNTSAPDTHISTPSPVARYRVYSPVTLEHLLTTDANEYTVLGQRGWTQEGVSHKIYNGPVQIDGVDAVPDYRLYHGGIRQHLWTTDRNEYDVLGTRGWTQEGFDGYLLQTAVQGVSVPLYRLSHGYLPLHLWTTDLNEYTVLATRGWTQEGIVGHVLP